MGREILLKTKVFNRNNHFNVVQVLWMQKLEPWLVSSIKVAGSLSLLSILAKGLPVTEDNDIVVDIENLKAPSIARKRLALLIGVFLQRYVHYIRY